MKKLIVILLFVLQAPLFAQSYTVIHSIGKIYDVGAEKYLSKGMKIDESAQLRFDSPNARAAVLSSSRGRYIIQANKSSSSTSDLAYALSSIISPVRGKLSTRAGGINNALDFSKYFGEGPVAALLDSYKVKVSPSAYPMNDDQFFYVQYMYEGEAINKKLSSEGESLVFDQSLYTIDGNSIDASQVGEMNLFYYNASTQESENITALTLNWVSMDDLKALASNFDTPKSDESVTALCEWVNDLFGKCSEEAVLSAVERL